MRMRLERSRRFFDRFPESVRLLALPSVLAVGVVVLAVNASATWQPPVGDPGPRGEAAKYCETLMKSLPTELFGHARTDPDPSPNVATWGSSPRTVLRCGVPRPESLDDAENQRAESPSVDNVTWYMEKDGHGGYRFTCTERRVFVEVESPAGAYPNFVDPLSLISTPVNSMIPDIAGRLNAGDDDAA
ncbi:DUF3515 domain-containing protein [Kitasatospora sp. NPDC059795]|uniref:DUF3515 domain-containing protein n=1 Tax=Kitasatospora sp. NPDC059795 TaxID=3346949 RepID=UPI003657D832